MPGKMFISAGRQFCQSSELMYLGGISESEYAGFIRSNFRKADRG